MNKRKELAKRLLSFLLAIVLAIEAVPLSVHAENETALTEAVEVSDGTTENPEQEIYVLNEVVEEREEYVKHFRMSDGSYVAAQYLAPVHFMKDGEWVEYDNTLEEAVAETEASEDAGSADLKNRTSDLDIRLSKKTNGKKFVRLEKDGYKLSWYYKDAEKVTAQHLEKETDEDAMTLEQMTSRVLYEEVFPEADLEYVIGATGLKENIILKEVGAPTTFVAEYQGNHLTPVAVDEQTIELQAEDGTVIYTIDAPYMVDSAGEYSEGVTLTLSNVKNNKFTVTTTLDEEWLSAEERAWPVTVDPVIETKRDRASIDSTYIASGSNYSSKNLSERLVVMVGWDTSEYGHMRTLVKFDLPSLNKGDMVVGASFAMALYHKSFYTSSMSDQQIDIHPLTESWTQTGVTWNNQPSYDTTIYDYNYIRQSDVENAANWKSYDITRIVKEWYEGTLTNNGVLIKQNAENGTVANNAANGWFWSEKYNDVTDAYPAIYINYRNNKGIEDYWSYSAYGIGNAGTAYINDYSGNLVYELPLLSSISERMPIELCGYYNTYCAGEPYAAGKNSSARTVIGKGFRLNVQQTVLPSSSYGLTGTAASTYPYVYTDGDGTEHYMQKETENGTTVYKDEDGLGITLRTGSDKDASYQITDKAGYDYYFNSKGNLLSWYDNNENGAVITYKPASSADGLAAGVRIQSITDGAGHVYTFDYYCNTDGIENDYVHTITDNAGRVITFVKDGGWLKKVVYSDGSETQIAYDSEGEGLLETVTSHEGYRLGFTYTTKEKGRRITRVREYLPKDEGLTEFIEGLMDSFDRSVYNTTVIRSSGNDAYHIQENSSCGDDDIITTLKFDNLGRTVSQQMSYRDGREIGAGSYQYTSSNKDTSTLGSKNKVSGSGSMGKNTVNFLQGGNA